MELIMDYDPVRDGIFIRRQGGKFFRGQDIPATQAVMNVVYRLAQSKGDHSWTFEDPYSLRRREMTITLKDLD